MFRLHSLLVTQIIAFSKGCGPATRGSPRNALIFKHDWYLRRTKLFAAVRVQTSGGEEVDGDGNQLRWRFSGGFHMSTKFTVRDSKFAF